MFRRTLAFACVAEGFVYQRIAAQHPDKQMSVPPALVVRNGEIDFTQTSSKPMFPLGTVFVTLSESSSQALAYFLDSPEKTEDRVR